MPTTANRGYTYPSSSGSVRPYADIQTLAEGVDNDVQALADLIGATPTAYTPTIAGHGTATWTTRTGWYFDLGKMFYMNAYLVVNAAGSGTSPVTVTAPFNVERTNRQVIAAHAESLFSTSSSFTGNLVALTSGTGAVMDRLRMQDNGATNKLSNLTGAGLTAGAVLVCNGWLRKA